MQTIGSRIRYARELHGWKQRELADAVGVYDRQNVTNWERDEGIALPNLIKVAEATEVSLDWLALGRGRQPTRKSIALGSWPIPVVGFVGADATAKFFPVDAGLIDEVPAPEAASPDTVALKIRGDSLGPIFDGWLAFYDDRREPVTDSLIKSLCVIGLAEDRVVLKRIARRRGERFDLESNLADGGNVFEAEVRWAARVLLLAPG